MRENVLLLPYRCIPTHPMFTVVEKTNFDIEHVHENENPQAIQLKVFSKEIYSYCLDYNS